MQCIGADGNAYGDLVLEKIVHSVISPPYLKDISWTGKGKQKERKIALCKFNYIIDFIKSITFKADKSFTEAKFKDKLIYGILKRAPSKYGATSKDDKENVDKSNLTTESNSDSHLQLSPSQEQQMGPKQLPIAQSVNHYPSNGQPPNYQPLIGQQPNHHPSVAQPSIHHYGPPYQSHEQQPYYGHQYAQWLAGVPPPPPPGPSNADYSQPTYYQL